MMYRTHLMVGVFFALLFLPAIENKISFAIVVLFCSLLPDVDSMHSKLGRHWFLRPIQWCIKHRDMLHSFTFCIIFTLFFVFYFPILALPFFLGYAGHLVSDAITIEGIRAWWPSKKRIEGKIKTDGKAEKWFYYVLILANFFFLIRFINIIVL